MTENEWNDILGFLADLKALRYKTVRMLQILENEAQDKAGLSPEAVKEGLDSARVQSYLYCLIEDIGLIFSFWRVDYARKSI